MVIMNLILLNKSNTKIKPSRTFSIYIYYNESEQPVLVPYNSVLFRRCLKAMPGVHRFIQASDFPEGGRNDFALYAKHPEEVRNHHPPGSFLLIYS